MYICYSQSLRILASFCSWAGWFDSYLVENLRRHIFAWHGSYSWWRFSLLWVTKYGGVYCFQVVRHAVSQWLPPILFFVSIQYLEKELMDFDQILHMHWYWQDLGWDYYASICNRAMAFDVSWLTFPLWQYLENELDGIWPNFAYALILTRSRLGLLHINFCKFVTE